MTVVTRFAPSPTGFLHIGGARTALFSWLFARHHGGKFLLRIEDTDRARSTPEAVDAIFEGLRWLGLDWDEEPVLQSSRAARHAEVAHAMIASGHAYACYCSPEELTQMREDARREGRSAGYDGRWRDRDSSEAPPGSTPVVRLKAPREGETVIQDLVQGEVKVANNQLDDMVLLRADGTPTYMLSVVVDDHDMGITHIIRGDDHLTNAFRQTQIYLAMGWDIPYFAHIPLIHGSDGAKLSKRHGALGAEAYRDMGILPEAIRNYLARLGWGHGDDEIFSTEQATAWFDIANVGRSAARFDMAKLASLNAHYLREADDARIFDLIAPRLQTMTDPPPDEAALARVRHGIQGLKTRARTLVELAENAAIYVRRRPIVPDDKARQHLDDAGRGILASMVANLAALPSWTQETLEEATRIFAETNALKLGKVAQPLRAAITGSTTSPPIFEVMEILGADEILQRLNDAFT